MIGNITDVVRTVDGETMITLDTGHTFQFKSYDIYWDSVRNAYIKKNGRYHQDALDNARYTAQAQAMYNRTYEKEASAAMSTASIKNVIFAPPATIVYWSDGSKTVVKCSEKDVFDPEKGLAMAIAKRCGGNKGSYYKEIQNWVEKSGKKYPGKPAAGKAVDLDVLKKYSSEANKDFEKFLSAAKSNDQSGVLLHLTALVADLKILEIEINK
nr:MAG: hypothetical protein [Bacteriophage sp.]